MADGNDDHWLVSLVPSAHFEKFMKMYRFKQFRKKNPTMYEDESLKESDEWWKFQPVVDEFNWIRTNGVLSAFWMIVDETMSAIGGPEQAPQEPPPPILVISLENQSH